jgi:lipoprotein-releasing system ATP-binding protein
MSEVVMKLVDVKKSFFQAEQEIEILKGASLEIKKSEMVALIGPSGSGKTTILQIAGLLDCPTYGTVLINEIDASKASDKMRTKIRKNNVGFVYQFHHLLPEFSAIENVALPLLIQKKSKEESFSAAQKILEEVGLFDRINHKPAELSGGQQQRVAIARAIVTKPSLILADEPTGNLDSEFSEKIFTLLQNLVKSYKIACLVVTHNLELAKKTDRVISIKNGIIL